MSNNITLLHYLTLSSIIFVIGVIGLLSKNRNLINILMSIELMLLAVNINFVSFSSFNNDIKGQIFSIILLTIAAAETAIGLALIVLFFRHNNTIKVKDINKLKG